VIIRIPRYVTLLAFALLMTGGWFLTVATSRYRSAPEAATVGTWVNIGPAPISYIGNPAGPDRSRRGRFTGASHGAKRSLQAEPPARSREDPRQDLVQNPCGDPGH
jgi:uncharacterized membrane protein